MFPHGLGQEKPINQPKTVTVTALLHMGRLGACLVRLGARQTEATG